MAYRSSTGFTLLEALVALIIFTIITTTLGMVLASTANTSERIRGYQDSDRDVRAAFGFLAHDLAAAYASTTDPNSLFLAGTSAQAPNSPLSSYDPGLLTFDTFTGRITTTDPNLNPMLGSPSQPSGSSTAADSAQQTALPQSRELWVRYSLQPDQTLLRQTLNVPSLQTLQSSMSQQNDPSQPPGVLLHNVQSLTLQFWDPSQNEWRTEWDFEQPLYQQNLAAQQQSSSGSATGASNAGSSAASSSSSSSSQTGDMQLPPFVKATIVLSGPQGQPETFTSILPVNAPMPLEANTQQAETSSSTANSSGTGGLP